MTTTSPLRIFYFGLRCAFSAPPLEALIDAGHEIVAVALPGPPFGPPMMSRPMASAIRLSPERQTVPSIDALAARASAPILTIGDLKHRDAISIIGNLNPDVISVACFPRLLPTEVLRIPRLGSVNVHPSLLPHGRGPEPLFWTFRRGERETGVTIHLLDDRFDAGPILLQERVPVPEGIRLPDFDHELAELGGTLLVEAIDQLATGRATPRPQNDTEATSAPMPSQADYDVPTDLPAHWAFNFVRAVAPTVDCLNVVLMATKEEISVVDAVNFRDSEELGVPYQMNENRVTVQFRPGSVTFILALSGNSKS